MKSLAPYKATVIPTFDNHRDQQEYAVESDDIIIAPVNGVLNAHMTKQCSADGDCFHCNHDFTQAGCQYKKMQQNVSCFNDAALPARFYNATIETLSHTMKEQTSSVSLQKAIQWIVQWIHREPLPKQGILLSGTQGTGKTFMIAALVRYLTLMCTIRCLFVDCGQFLSQLKRCYNTNDDDYILMEKLYNVDVLILDDLGSTRQSQWSQDIFQQIIAKRYNSVSRTFITTNLTLNQEIKRWLSVHCYSRLQELCYFLRVDGEDSRFKKIPL